MTTPMTGLLSAVPVRADTGERRRARIALVLLVLLVLLCLMGGGSVEGPRQTPAALTSAVLDGTRHGGDYYQAAADALRSYGAGSPSGWAVPLPAAILVRVHLPTWAATGLLWALAGVVFAAWHARLLLAGTGRWVRVAAAALPAVALAPSLLPSAADVPEVWAGLLAAWMLVLPQDTRQLEATALGLAASVLSVAALPVLLAAAGVALAGGRRREAAWWTGALLLAALVFGLHLAAIARVSPGTSPLPDFDPVAGLAPLALAVREATVLMLLPQPVVAPMVGAALWAWAMSGDAWRPMVPAALAALAAASVLTTLPVGSVAALPLLSGLVLLPHSLARTTRAAGARSRRITIKRVVR